MSIQKDVENIGKLMKYSLTVLIMKLYQYNYLPHCFKTFLKHFQVGSFCYFSRYHCFSIKLFQIQYPRVATAVVETSVCDLEEVDFDEPAAATVEDGVSRGLAVVEETSPVD